MVFVVFPNSRRSEIQLSASMQIEGAFMFLVSDIGGTNTRLALYEDKSPLKLVAEKVYSSTEEKELSIIIDKFLSDNKAQVKKACLAIAGPVRDGVCKATNLPWVIDSKELSQKNKIEKVYLLNDLLAHAYGISALQEDEFLVLNKGQKQEGNACLISAGTGLGEAGIVWEANAYLPFASEGGHSDFASRDQLEFELLLFLQKKYGHVSYERVLSGPGMTELYEFLTIVKGEKPSGALSQKIREEADIPKVITEMGLAKDPLCERILDWFVSFYGAEASNLALKFLSLSGVYIGGGIAPRLAEKMKESFLSSFIDKGRFQPVLESMPVKLILNDKTALLGAATFGLKQG